MTSTRKTGGTQGQVGDGARPGPRPARRAGVADSAGRPGARGGHDVKPRGRPGGARPRRVPLAAVRAGRPMPPAGRSATTRSTPRCWRSTGWSTTRAGWPTGRWSGRCARRGSSPSERRAVAEAVYGITRWQGQLDWLLAAARRPAARPRHPLRRLAGPLRRRERRRGGPAAGGPGRLLAEAGRGRGAARRPDRPHRAAGAARLAPVLAGPPLHRGDGRDRGEGAGGGAQRPGAAHRPRQPAARHPRGAAGHPGGRGDAGHPHPLQPVGAHARRPPERLRAGLASRPGASRSRTRARSSSRSPAGRAPAGRWWTPAPAPGARRWRWRPRCATAARSGPSTPTPDRLDEARRRARRDGVDNLRVRAMAGRRGGRRPARRPGRPGRRGAGRRPLQRAGDAAAQARRPLAARPRRSGEVRRPAEDAGGPLLTAGEAGRPAGLRHLRHRPDRERGGGRAIAATLPFDPAPLATLLGAERAAALGVAGHTLQLLPHRHGTDGFFMAAFTRRKD